MENFVMYTSLDQPSMALNDSRLGSEVQMWNTRFVKESDSLGNIFDNIVSVAKSAPGGKLKNLIFNCHGFPGYLQMGEGIDRVSSVIFRMLSRPKPLVETIWLRACQVARIDKPGAAVQGDGNLFCSEIAQYAQCVVVAATADQIAHKYVKVHPFGCLDEFEGTLLRYGPSGAVVKSETHPAWSMWTSE
jgi:hypothetical protein